MNYFNDYSKFQYSELQSTIYPALSKTVFTLFMILVPILLLNMLIAMMGNTYAHVIEQSEKEWMKQVCNFKRNFSIAHSTNQHLFYFFQNFVKYK